MAATINPLRYARRIEASGVPRAQAEAIAEGAAEELGGDLEQRLGRVEAGLDGLRAEVGELRHEMRVGFAEIRTEIAGSKAETLRWLVPLLMTQLLAMLAQVGATLFLVLRATGAMPP